MRKTLLAVVFALLFISAVGLLLFSEIGFSGRGHGAQNGSEGSLGLNSIWLLIFAVPVALALIIVVYLIAFPEIKQKKKDSNVVTQTTSNQQTLEAVLRVLSEDERKVVQVIAASETGSILQKEIGWKTNFSRVKTHRVIARLSQRGIVQVEKHFSTNKITLAEWINKNNSKESA